MTLMLHFITYRQKYVILWAKYSCTLLCQQATHSFRWEIQLAEQWPGFLCLVSCTHSAYCNPDTHMDFVKMTTCPKPKQHVAVFPNNLATYFSEWHSYNTFWWLSRFMKACTSLTWSTFPVAYPSWFCSNKHFWVCFCGVFFSLFCDFGLVFFCGFFFFFLYISQSLLSVFMLYRPSIHPHLLVQDPSSVLSNVEWDLSCFTADLRHEWQKRAWKTPLLASRGFLPCRHFKDRSLSRSPPQKLCPAVAQGWGWWGSWDKLDMLGRV